MMRTSTHWKGNTSVSDRRVRITSYLPMADPTWQPARFSPGRLAWLEQACYWVIRKLGGKFEHAALDVTYQDHGFKLVKELEEVIQGLQHSIYGIWREDLKYVLVGRQELQEMNSWPFDALMHLSYSYDPRGKSTIDLNGLTIILVPWMKGIIALPDVF